MYFSVTSANCSTSPVSRSVFESRTDLTKPPNSAPITSSGTSSDLMESMAMPSRPMRLTASAPSTRARMPSRTCLNMALLAAGDFREPVFEAGDLLLNGLDVERGELFAHGVVGRIALEDRLVDPPRLGDEALARVEVGHRDGVGRLWRGQLFLLAVPRRGDVGAKRRFFDVEARGRFDFDRGGGEDRFFGGGVGELRLGLGLGEDGFGLGLGLGLGFWRGRDRRELAIELLDHRLDFAVARHQRVHELVLLDRLDLFARGEVAVGEEPRRHDVAGIELQRLRQRFDRIVALPLLARDAPEGDPGGEIAGVIREAGAQHLLRVRARAALPQLLGERIEEAALRIRLQTKPELLDLRTGCRGCHGRRILSPETNRPRRGGSRGR